METVTALPCEQWAQAIEDTIRYYGTPPLRMETTLLFKPEEGQFVMLHRGYYYEDYENRVVAHLELRDGHIYVHDEDAGMNFIAPSLIQQGVPRDKITVVSHPHYHIEKA